MIDPPPEITDAQQRHQSRLLSALLLIVILLGSVSGLVQLLIVPGFLSTFIAIGGAVVILAIAYALTRTRYYLFAATIASLTPFVASYICLLTNPKDESAIIFMLVGVLLSSILLNQWFTIGIASLNLLGLLLLPLLQPAWVFSDLLGKVSYHIIISALIIIAMRHRDRVERDGKKELLENELKFRSIFDNSVDAIGVSKAGIHAMVNPAYVKMFGYDTADRLVGKSILDLIAPPERSQILEYIRSRAAGESAPSNYETRGLRYDNTEFDIEVYVSTYELGGEIFTVPILRDITQRKQIEEQLRSQANLLQNVSDAIVASDLDHKIISWNQAAETLYGWRKSEIIGKPVDKVLQTEYLTESAEQVRRQFLEQGFWKGEVIHKHKDGTRLYILASVSSIIDENGQPKGVVAVNRDITQRKRTEVNLRLSEERYRTLAQNLPDSALLLYDQDLRFIIADGPEIEATGFSREQMEGKTLHEALPAEFAQQVEPNMRRTLAGEKFSAELPFQDRFYRYSYVPLRDNSGHVVMAMILATNITRIKKTEEALKDSQRRLGSALRATNVGVWEWDIRTNEAYWSDENYRVMGLEPGEIKSTYENWAKCVHPEDLPAASAKVTEAVNKKGDLDIEFRVVWPDGSIHWINDIGSMLVDESTGQPLGLYGIQMDITERKRVEAERGKLISELEAKNAEAETLRESAAAVALSLDLDETVSRILDQLHRVVPFDSASIQLLKGDELEVIGGRGFPEGRDAVGMRFTLDENDAAYPTLKDGLPYIFYPNVQMVSDKFKDSDHEHILSWMAIPLYARGRLIGFFALDGFSVNKFTEAHARFALTFANQVAVTLENSRLYTDIQLELKKQIALHTAATAISSSLRVNEVLSEICQQMASTIDATSAYIASYDPNHSSYTIATEYIGPYANELECVSDLGVTYFKKDGVWVFDEKSEDLFAIIHSDDENLTPWARNNLVTYGGKSVLYIPLRIHGRLIGHAELWESRKKREFTGEEISFCQALSQQAAVAIAHATLFEQLQEELAEHQRMQEILYEEKERAEVTLHSIGDAVITTDSNGIVKYINPVAENFTGWKAEDAIGQSLSKVFQIVEETSRMPALNPVERCLQEGKIVGLANQTLLISRNGREYAIDDTAAPIRNSRGEVKGVVLVFHDETEQRRLTQQLAHDAKYDGLTGIVNRREFERRLEMALIKTKEHGTAHVLCYLDLDQFKVINDTAGHAAGDELLKQIPGLLGGLFRQRDTLARLGGDEFGLLLENCPLEEALVISNEIINEIRNYAFIWAGQRFQVGVSIGVVSISAETESIALLLSQADVACYSAKDLGRGRVHVYQSEDGETSRRHGEILQVARLQDAIAQNQFQLYCQPIVRLTDEGQETVQYETLLRMMVDEDLILPGVFIPSAERYGLMPTIDRWVIRETFRAMAEHKIQKVLVTINLSGNTLNEETLLKYVFEQLAEYSIQPGQICFEITETAAIHTLSKAQQFIRAFREQGGKIALDDFGSGFSSFRYLKTLSVDFIKIDGGFVSDMLSNPSDLSMVEAITHIGHKLGIQIIAEHATDQETIQQLRRIGVDYAQGFGISLPVSLKSAWADNDHGSENSIEE